MPQPSKDDIRLSIDVPREIWAKIAALSVLEGREKRAIVADALDMYIAKKEGK
jgi:predicted DNA-binding protein